MDKFKNIFSKAQGSAAAVKTDVLENKGEKLGKGWSKFMVNNKFPRYVLYTIILVKFTFMYDKSKQLVSINNIYGQIIREQRVNLRSILKVRDGSSIATEQELIQDLLTRRQF